MPMPLVALKVIGKVPATDGSPERTPPSKVRPAGNVPASVMVGVGLPVAVGVKLPVVPSVKVAVFGEVKAANVLPLGPGMADQVNPLGSEPLAVKVISVFQLSGRPPRSRWCLRCTGDRRR